MRLDHLLSKEHLDLFGGSRTQYHTDCVWLGLKGGTFDMASAQLGSTSTPRPFGGVVGGWVLVSGAPARCWVLRDRTLPSAAFRGGGGGGSLLMGLLIPAPFGGWGRGVPPVL